METHYATRPKTIKKDFYYTHDHEWIDFQGTVAYLGVCPFKLTGFRQIHKVVLSAPYILYKQGEIIGSLSYNDYKIDIHMPVAGKIKYFNPELTTGDHDILLNQPEDNGWFALIAPASPYDRQGLLISEQYRMKQFKR